MSNFGGFGGSSLLAMQNEQRRLSSAVSQSVPQGGYYTPPDPYSIQFDPETGYPRGLRGPPAGQYALRYQYRGEEVRAQRNAELRRQARAYMDQAIGLSESYRPGGFASLHSGIYQNASQVALASQIDQAPDLLSQYREDAIRRAESAAKKRRKLGALGNILGGIGTIVGGIVGGPAGAAVGSGLGQSIGAGGQALSSQIGGETMGMLDPPDGGSGGPAPGASPSRGSGGAPSSSMGAPPGGGYEDGPAGGGGGQQQARMGGGGDEGMKIRAASNIAASQLRALYNDGFWDGLDVTLRDAMAEVMASLGA